MDVLATNGPLCLTDLSGRVDLHPSTVHRHLTTLAEYGYVYQSPATREYSLGVHLLELGGSVHLAADLRARARRHIADLAHAARETVNLVIRDAHQGMILDRIDSDQTLKFSMPIGARVPLHATAAGKALLAHIPAEDAESVIAEGLPRLTPNTIVDRAELLRELESVRARGYAVDNEEHEIGVRCIAAPIWDSSGRLIASVSVSAPIARVTSQRVARLAELVRRTALSISCAIGYNADS